MSARATAIAMLALAACGGGTVAAPRPSIAGLSAVEAFPATAEEVTLAPNSLLVDGDTTTPAGIDVGFGPSLLGDHGARDVGVRFDGAVTPVDTIHVWLDRTLAPEVGAALTSAVAVYRSDDNLRWTAVMTDRPPVVSARENRVEITTLPIQAEFLKVTLLPLAPGVTAEAMYRAVLVTEVQVLSSTTTP